MRSNRDELARALRRARERVSPEDVGLPVGSHRRVAGLRREEVAMLAGISVDYVVRLEQGRDPHPSDQVVGALVRALSWTGTNATTPSTWPVSRHRSPAPSRCSFDQACSD